MGDPAFVQIQSFPFYTRFNSDHESSFPAHAWGQVPSGHSRNVARPMFPADGSVLRASWGETAKTWDCSSGVCEHRLSGRKGHAMSTVFPADGSSLLKASFDMTANIWDCSSGASNQTLAGDTES